MSELEKNNDISYILNELGEDRNLYFNAIAPPIIQTSNFAYVAFICWFGRTGISYKRFRIGV